MTFALEYFILLTAHLLFGMFYNTGLESAWRDKSQKQLRVCQTTPHITVQQLVSLMHVFDN